MISLERALYAAALFALAAVMPAPAVDAPVPSCKPWPALGAWIVHEDCLARGGHDCAVPDH